MRPTKLEINFGNHTLRFDLLDTPITDLWLERMSIRTHWPLDDPKRFYGFNDIQRETHIAEQMIKKCIETINRHAHVIDREFTSIDDQDLMNYLHNIFERYHGMLDQQNHDFWNQAPEDVRQALADLNIAVHRCESVRSQSPRLVCTWFGMPKTKHLPLELQEKYGQIGCDFGGVYLNYVEIGKTACDMAKDNDQYMANEMFKPFDFYSADFFVAFYSRSCQDMLQVIKMIDQYFQKNKLFFDQFGITSSDDIRIKPIRHKVAQLDFEDMTESAILELIRQNQIVTKINLT